MPGEPTILHQRLPSQWSAATQGGLFRLPADAVHKARTRMNALATVFIVAFLIGITNNEIAAAADILPIGLERARLTNGAGLLTSLLMFAVARSSRASDQTVLIAGIAFLVEIASVTMLIAVYMTTEGPLSAMTWAIPILILYPLVIPTPPLVTAMVCAFVAALAPLLAWGIPAAGLLDKIPTGQIFLFTFNHGLGAVIAVAASSVVYQLNLEVAEAKMLGAYRLEEVLGRGGMGEVWRGTHRLLSRPAAIKVVRPDMLGDLPPERREEVVDRFTREAKATSALTSPHTVELYDFGTAQDGSFFYVIDGRTDLYALGCVAWWLLTGRLVFKGKAPMEFIAMHLKDTPEPPSTYAELPIPPALDELVLSCLAKTPDGRPADATELQHALHEIDLEPWTDDQAERWWRQHHCG